VFNKFLNNQIPLPFLKWAGGKRKLLPEIKKYIPDTFSHYCEPFVGAGALLFELMPKNALINDINSDLINVYNVIRDNVDALIQDLKRHINKDRYYYKLRELDRKSRYLTLSKIKRASRLI